MKRKIKLIITLCLVATLLLSSVAFAAVQGSSYLNSYYTDIIRNGNGNITVEFGVYSPHSMQVIGVSKIQVYKSTGVLYRTIYSSTPGYTDLLGSNAALYIGSADIQLTSGQSYYLIVTFYAKDSTGSGKAPLTTSTFTA